MTPLIEAARGGHYGVCVCLIENGADVNARIDGNVTPLMGAAKYGNADIVRLLLERGAEVDAETTEGENFEAGWTPLFWAIKNGHDDIALLLIKRGADVEMMTVDGWSALMFAARNGCKDIVPQLIRKKVNIQQESDMGYTALELAAHKGHYPIVVSLVESGAAVNWVDAENETPLSWARKKGHRKIARYLLEHGAKAAEIVEMSKALPKITGKYLHHAFENTVHMPEEGGENFRLAVQCWNKGKYDNCLELLEKAIDSGLTESFEASAHSLLGQIYLEKRNREKTVSHFLRCLEHPGGNRIAVWPAAIRLYILYREADRIQESEKLLALANAANTMGWALDSAGEDEIRKIFKK
jgi:ankyrin repeat protein